MDKIKTRQTNRTVRILLNNIVWIILFLSIAAFSLSIDGYASIRNYINIVYHAVFIGLLAIAESYCLISGNLDLSVESVAAFGAITSAYLCGASTFASGLLLNPFLGLFIVMSVGAVVGIVNAFFILKLKINAFLVTLSTYIIVRGLAVLLTGGKGVSQLPGSFKLVNAITMLNIPLLVYIMIIFFIFFHFILETTTYGKHLFIIGGNVDTANNFGINVNKHIFGVFILSGIISGITGWLMTSRAGGATPAMASGFLFEVLAAVIIGGVSMFGGIGSLVGVFAGVLLLSSIRSALNILAISPFLTEVIRGLLVLIAIVLDSIKRLLR
jgi:ribose transport system permease protein